MDIGVCRTILVEKVVEKDPNIQEQEPDFMRYIKNMNVNYVNNEYIKGHFED